MDSPRPCVRLRDIVEALDVPNEEWSVFLNRRTGRLVTLTGDDDEEDAEDIDGSDDWLQLPDKFKIDDYDTMLRFCHQVADAGVRNELLGAIQGSGAFRRFNGLIRQHGQLDAGHA